MAANPPSLARRVWQTVASVRTGIVLLILVVIFSAAGTFILQRPATDPEELQRAYSPHLLRWLDRLSLTDVFHAWWFAALLGLLSVTIVAASIQRFPKVWKFFARPYRRPDRYFRAALPTHKLIPVRDGGVALIAAEKAFRRDGLHPQRVVENDDVSLYAERNRFSLLAVYVVHASLLLIFAGGIIDAVYGYRGFLALTRGQQSTQISLQSGGSRALPFTVRCDGAGQENYSDGTPKRWWSNLVVLENGRESLRKQIVVNDPLVYRGIRFYQSSYGSNGELDKVLLTASKTGSTESQDIELALNSELHLDANTTVRLLQFIPDFVVRDNEIYARSNQPNNPAIQLEVASSAPRQTSKVWLFPQFGDFSHEQKSPYNFRFRDLQMGYFTGLQVSHEPGQWLVWTGCVLMALGLATALYLVHGRYWAMVIRDGEGGLALWVGAAANRNRDVFEQRFRRLTDAIQAELKTRESEKHATADVRSLARV